MTKVLGELEQLILFALVHLGENAYGASIRREIESRAGRSVVAGAIYTALERLESRGMVSSRIGEPTPERGGRRKKYYTIQRAGAAALHHSYQSLTRMGAEVAERVAALASGRVGA